MVKIPTFTATEKPTTDIGSVTTGIQISPKSTIAASLLPSANELTNYAIKKRDNEEKLIAKTILLDLKAESDKIIESQKNNIEEFEAINNWKTTFTPLVNEKISSIKNRRVKTLVKNGVDLENSESIYHLKTNSFKAYEKESTKIYNDEIAIGVNNYKATDNPILKVKYKIDLKDKAEKFNKEHMLGANDLKKRLEGIDIVLLLTDADSFIGLPNAEKQIANLDSSLKGETILSNEEFNKSIYNSYESKINSLAVEGDPNSDYDEAIRLVNELENFKRYNGNKVVSGTFEKNFAELKERVLGESIRHEDKVTKIQQGNVFFEYSQGQKKILEATFYNAFDASLNKAASKEKSFEAGQEYDQRIDAYLSSNPDATYSEKQEYARELRMNIIDKYQDIGIEKVTAFNLTSNKFNVTRETDAIYSLKQKYDADPEAPNTLKSLATLNGFIDKNGKPDVGAFLNVYIPILEERKKN